MEALYSELQVGRRPSAILHGAHVPTFVRADTPHLRRGVHALLALPEDLHVHRSARRRAVDQPDGRRLVDFLLIF